MSDIEILLRELIDKVDNLEKKVDRIEKLVTPPKFNIHFDWGDDSCERFLRNPELKEIKDPIPNPYEITCKGDNNTHFTKVN